MDRDPVEILMKRVDEIFKQNERNSHGRKKYNPTFISKRKDFEERVYWAKLHKHGDRFPVLYDKRWEERSFDDRLRLADFCDILMSEGVDVKEITFDDLVLLDENLESLERDIKNGRVKVKEFDETNDVNLVPLKVKLAILKGGYKVEDALVGDGVSISTAHDMAKSKELNDLIDELFNPKPNDYYKSANSAFRDYFMGLKDIPIFVGGEFRESTVIAHVHYDDEKNIRETIKIEFNPIHYYKIYDALKKLSRRAKLDGNDATYISVLFHEYQHAMHVTRNKKFKLPDKDDSKDKPKGDNRALYEGMNEMVARLDTARILQKMYGGTGYDNVEYFDTLSRNDLFAREEINIIYQEISKLNTVLRKPRPTYFNISSTPSLPDMDPELLCYIIEGIKYMLNNKRVVISGKYRDDKNNKYNEDEIDTVKENIYELLMGLYDRFSHLFVSREKYVGIVNEISKRIRNIPNNVIIHKDSKE